VTSLVRPREGRPQPPGAYEGIPDHLQAPIGYWLHSKLTQPGGHHFDRSFISDVVGRRRKAAETADQDKNFLLDSLSRQTVCAVGAGNLISRE